MDWLPRSSTWGKCRQISSWHLWHICDVDLNTALTDLVQSTDLSSAGGSSPAAGWRNDRRRGSSLSVDPEARRCGEHPWRWQSSVTRARTGVAVMRCWWTDGAPWCAYVQCYCVSLQLFRRSEKLETRGFEPLTSLHLRKLRVF